MGIGGTTSVGFRLNGRSFTQVIIYLAEARYQAEGSRERMPHCFFATDLHGDTGRYKRLFEAIENERPDAVFLGGDLTPRIPPAGVDDFLAQWVRPSLEQLRIGMGTSYPRVFVILGNDDAAADEDSVRELEADGLWEHLHLRRVEYAGLSLFGCAYVPPTPFTNKDWERYDVSRYVPPGGVSPEEGFRSRPLAGHMIRHRTIQRELDELLDREDLSRAILLFHSPPSDTHLDRAATDGMMIDHCPLDLHVGSVAIRRLIEDRQPAITLHGHIHESARITGSWRDRIGRSHLFTAAHDGPELALVAFDTEDPAGATRRLIPVAD